MAPDAGESPERMRLLVAVPGAAVWVGATAGGAVCPKAGVATATTKVASKRKSPLHCHGNLPFRFAYRQLDTDTHYNKTSDGARYVEGVWS